MMGAARSVALRAQATAWRALAAALDAEADALDAEVGTRVPGLRGAYLPAAEYAARISMSERTVWNLIQRGLPTIGSGRGRRVDVVRADEWLAEHRDHVDDAVERQARAAARAAAEAAE